MLFLRLYSLCFINFFNIFLIAGYFSLFFWKNIYSIVVYKLLYFGFKEVLLMEKVKDEWAPLSAGFMLTSMLGFMISFWYIMDLSKTWGFTFTFFFVIMFLASLISMTKANPRPESLDVLTIHDKEKAYKGIIRTPKKKAKQKGLSWYEPVFFLYLIVWIFYIFAYFAGNIDNTHLYLDIGFLAFNVFFMVFFLVEIFSRESLYVWEQIIYAIAIILTGGYGSYFFPIAGIGLLIYYLSTKFAGK